MPKINGNRITPRTVVDHDGGLWGTVKTNAVKPGKGGAFNQVELKNLIAARKLNERFRAGETVETIDLELKAIDLELKACSFLYAKGDTLIGMDLETHGQIELATDWLGERAAFLQDGMQVGMQVGMKVPLQMHGSRPVSIRLAPDVTLKTVEADFPCAAKPPPLAANRRCSNTACASSCRPLPAAAKGIVAATSEATTMRRAD